jgi:hypothetical protein
MRRNTGAQDDKQMQGSTFNCTSEAGRLLVGGVASACTAHALKDPLMKVLGKCDQAAAGELTQEKVYHSICS